MRKKPLIAMGCGITQMPNNILKRGECRNTRPKEERKIDAETGYIKELTEEENFMSESKKSFNKDKPFIFVSYKSENRDVVKRCVKDLVENYNMNIWYDINLHAGLIWSDEAGQKIRDSKCKAVVLFASAEALTSKNIEKELALAKRYEIPIIPINFVNRSFEKTLRDEIRTKHNDESSYLVEIAESIIDKYLDTNLKYLILDDESFYEDLVSSINKNTNLIMGEKKPESRKTHSNSHVSKEDINISNSTGEGKKTVEETKVFSTSASANDLRSKLIEKLGGDEVKSKAVFWIKADKKFRLRSTTSTINNNKPNEQYDYLICEIKGKYGVFSSEQEKEKITTKDLDLNFDGLIVKIKEKLEEETKNGNRICPTSEEKDDKNGKNKDEEENDATPIDLGKALNDYKHLAEVFIKTYENVDPKRIECFTTGTIETLKFNKDGRNWAIEPKMGDSEPIPEGELLTAIETLASNFRSNEKHLWKVFLRYDRLFDCTGTDFELYVREEKQRRRFFITGVVESKG